MINKYHVWIIYMLNYKSWFFLSCLIIANSNGFANNSPSATGYFEISIIRSFLIPNTYSFNWLSTNAARICLVLLWLLTIS